MDERFMFMLHSFMASGVYLVLNYALFQTPCYVFFFFLLKYPRFVTLIIILDVVILLIE